jgi:hypothetical protein
MYNSFMSPIDIFSPGQQPGATELTSGFSGSAGTWLLAIGLIVSATILAFTMPGSYGRLKVLMILGGFLGALLLVVFLFLRYSGI